MPTVTTDPIRERIMQFLFTVLENIDDPDTGSRLFDIVTRMPVKQSMMKQQDYIVGLYDMREKKYQKIGVEYCHLGILIELYTRTMVGDDAPSNPLSKAIALIEKAFGVDSSCGGLVIDLQLTASELDLEHATFKCGAGVATFDAQYRHALNDPFRSV